MGATKTKTVKSPSQRARRARASRPHTPDTVYFLETHTPAERTSVSKTRMGKATVSKGIGRSRRPARNNTRTSLRIGIDLGGTKTEGVVMDPHGGIVRRERVPTPQALGYEAILRTVHDLVFHLEQAVGAHGPLRVGIGTPGALSPTGLLKNSNTVCLNGRPLLQDLERALGHTVRITNDANCLAISEAIDGAAAGHRVVFAVILGTGVGGGIVIDGRVHGGRSGIAGEWGHNVLEPDGPQCYCGKRGCVETFLSGPALARDYAANGGESGQDAKTIAARAEAGDPMAEAAIRRYLDRFGRAMSVVINILDPDAIVLGGGLSNIDRLYREGPAYVGRYVFAAHGTALHTTDEVPPILKNRFGDSSGVRGAAQLWRPDE